MKVLDFFADGYDVFKIQGKEVVYHFKMIWFGDRNLVIVLN